MILDHPAYKYARAAALGKVEAPKYVKKQCREFAHMAQGKSKEWVVSEEKLAVVDGLTRLMIMPKGFKAQSTIHDAAAGYQWLLWVASLCVVSACDHNARRYEYVLLEIARKNAKTFDVAVLFLLLMLTEPRFSEFYSVAPNGALSRVVRKAIREIIKVSPALAPHFRVLRDTITCKLNDNVFTPLNYGEDTLDSRQPSAFLVDEVGKLPNSYAIEAMRSGQLGIKNKLGCAVSTKYKEITNPFEDEVSYAKQVLDGLRQDQTIFALLYEPDHPKDWRTDDRVLMHANPLALEVREIWDALLLKRTQAIAKKNARSNFLHKHCNIMGGSEGLEGYVSVEDVRRGKADRIDWAGREVFLGLDLAMTNDNCAMAMVALDDDEESILSETIAFFPEGRMEAKNADEKLDYQDFIDEGRCFACGDEIVSYSFIEETALAVAEKYGVTVLGMGFDRANAMSSAQKLEAGGIPCTIVVQNSSHLHPATKWLSEVIERGKFKYTQNTLLELNFQAARCSYDTNMNRYVNKKKSAGKVDMVVANIIAMYMLKQYLENGGGSWGAQM